MLQCCPECGAGILFHCTTQDCHVSLVYVLTQVFVCFYSHHISVYKNSVHTYADHYNGHFPSEPRLASWPVDYRMQWTAWGSVFDTVTFLFVYETYRELMNGFAPNSQGRCVWSLIWTSLNIKIKGQGHHGQKTGFSADTLGIAELISDILTQKTCLVPRLDEFEGQGQFWQHARGLCLENIFALVFFLHLFQKRILR